MAVARTPEITEERLAEAMERGRFATWLASRPDDEPVGRARHEYSCPIACYMADAIGVDVEANRVSVTETRVVVQDRTFYGVVRSLPAWAACFVRGVDREPEDYRRFGQPVTKAEALDILASCE
jgi:hypothetical protein